MHNPEVRGNLLYASWYAHGVRVLISDPANPPEIAFWAWENEPADGPQVDIWSAVPHRDLLLLSDRNQGLYILKHVPPRGRP